MRFKGIKPAPDLNDSEVVSGVGTTKPADLRGKLVLILFWATSSVNCRRVAAIPNAVAEEYPDEVAVIGVHSPLFKAEKNADLVKNAARARRMEYPIINDPHHKIADTYGLSDLPTLFFVDPLGKIVASHSGEFSAEGLRRIVGRMVAEFRQNGMLSGAKREKPPRTATKRREPLLYPTNVLFYEGTLYIADSGNGRVLATGEDGKGSEIVCGLAWPCGLAAYKNEIFISDSEGDAVYAVDLKTHRKRVLLGGEDNGPRTPTGLEVVRNNLYITETARHRILKFDLKTAKISVYAGTGKNGAKDGLCGAAQLAQPGDCVAHANSLFFGDGASSTVRSAGIGPGGRVVTIVGTGYNSGDGIGKARDARLQYPTGLAYSNDRLYIADCYNNKIKVLDMATFMVANLVTEAGLKQPGGLTCSDTLLYVADTNNHRVRVFDRARGEERESVLKEVRS